MEKLKIKAVLGSVRTERVADTVWVWLKKLLDEIPEYEVELLDLRELNLPMFSETDHPVSGAPHATEAARTWSAKMAEADGFIIITPEYDHMLPGSLLNAFDYLAQEWNKKPVAIVAYGGASGGARASESMKALLTYMETVIIPVEVNIAHVPSVFDASGNLPDAYANTARKMFTGLTWWGTLLHDARAKLNA